MVLGALPLHAKEAFESRADNPSLAGRGDEVSCHIDRSAIRNIAVFRALKLGDMLCAVPALRALRSGFPGAHIALIGLPWARDFADRFAKYVDSFRTFPGYPGLPEQAPDPEAFAAFVKSMRKQVFDLVLQFHGSGAVSNEVVEHFDARLVAGFVPSGMQPHGAGFFVPYPDQGLELRRLLQLLEQLGIHPRGEHLEFPVFAREREEARRIVESYGLRGKGFVCVHPGASVPERRWPIDRFAAVADALAARGFGIVLTGGAEEASLTRELARIMRARPVDLAGSTSLGVLAALLEDARLLICNDTGVSHIADGLQMPSVVISTGDNPARWAPVDGRLHRVLCRTDGVAVEEVLAASLGLLAGEEI